MTADASQFGRIVTAEDLRLESLTVIHAGTRAFPLAEKIEAVPLSGIRDHLPRLDGAAPAG